MRKAAVGATALLVATLFSGNAFSLTTEDVLRVIGCDCKVVRMRGRCGRTYCVPRRRPCQSDFGLSVQ